MIISYVQYILNNLYVKIIFHLQTEVTYADTNCEISGVGQHKPEKQLQ